MAQAGEIQPGLCIEKLKYGPLELFWRNEVNFCAIKIKSFILRCFPFILKLKWSMDHS